MTGRLPHAPGLQSRYLRRVSEWSSIRQHKRSVYARARDENRTAMRQLMVLQACLRKVCRSLRQKRPPHQCVLTQLSLKKERKNKKGRERGSSCTNRIVPIKQQCLCQQDRLQSQSLWQLVVFPLLWVVVLHQGRGRTLFQDVDATVTTLDNFNFYYLIKLTSSLGYR